MQNCCLDLWVWVYVVEDVVVAGDYDGVGSDVVAFFSTCYKYLRFVGNPVVDWLEVIHVNYSRIPIDPREIPLWGPFSRVVLDVTIWFIS